MLSCTGWETSAKWNSAQSLNTVLFFMFIGF